MTENKRFTNADVYGWSRSAFLEVMNGLDEKNKKLREENEQLRQKVEDLEFALRTELAHQRIEKEKHSDTVYSFKKKLDKW